MGASAGLRGFTQEGDAEGLGAGGRQTADRESARITINAGRPAAPAPGFPASDPNAPA
jgi:hypothetical protein